MPQRNDWIRYVEINPYDEVNDPRVMVLGDLEFNIDSAALLPAGKYTASDMINNYYVNMNDHYNTPTAIVVPAKMTAQLFVRDNFEGHGKVIEGPAKVLFHSEGYHDLIDKVRSIIVTKDKKAVLEGHWHRVMSYNSDSTYTLTKSFQI